ncbi:MAG: hypothetical protein R6T96_02610 [Longimicrobiales bacterium]
MGILPPTRRLPQFLVDLWVPVRMGGESDAAGHSFWGVARMKDGVTLDRAGNDLQKAAETAAVRDPEARLPDATIVPFPEAIHGPDVKQTSVAFGVAVFFVLLIACGNIANLLLALGADRPGVVRHVLLGSGRTAVIGLTLGAVLLASLLPALKASGVDPVRTLSSD